VDGAGAGEVVGEAVSAEQANHQAGGLRGAYNHYCNTPGC
jgi:hypothetical protein